MLIDGVEVKDIPGFTNYAISSCGKHLWSKPRPAPTSYCPNRQAYGRWLKFQTQKPPGPPYPRVALTEGEVTKRYQVSRLVALTWIGPPPFEGAWVLHGPDDDPQNNDYRNLRWGTPGDNTWDMRMRGRDRFSSVVRNRT